MSELATKLRRVNHVRRRASIVLVRLCRRLFLGSGTRHSAIPGPATHGGRRGSWAWLRRTVRRRAASTRERTVYADPVLTQEPDLKPARRADLTLAAPKIGKLAETIPIDLRRSIDRPLQRRVVAIADCENDTTAVADSLRFVGMLSKRGKIKAKARGAHIVQTGDLLHKNGPDPKVAEFWVELHIAAEKADCALHLVAGNHELEIWRKLQSGARLGLNRGEQQAVQGLIRRTKLFHAEGSMLFIHGYPTVRLLRHVQAYCTDTGKGLNDYNVDCFQAAFDDPKLLTRYAYRRRNAAPNSLLYDVPNPARYYRRHGREIAELLGALGIDLVVHGHRPERSGKQTDFELQRFLPGIRMISHDIQLRFRGLGAMVVRQTEQGPVDLLFLNKDSATPAHRADIRRLLREPSEPFEHPPGPEKDRSDGQISNRAGNRDMLARSFAASGS